MSKLEYLAWAPTRQIFVERMQAYINPTTGTKLADIDPETGELIPSDGVRIDEIGLVTKENGEVIEGHHVNFWCHGALEAMLNANGGWVAIFALLGDMVHHDAENGIPEGWEGTSGMRIIHPSSVNHRVRVWA